MKQKTKLTDNKYANLMNIYRSLKLKTSERTKNWIANIILAAFSCLILHDVKAQTVCPCGVVVLVGDQCPCVTYYPDADHDGYGNPALGVIVGQGGLIAPPAGYVLDGRDCDDNNSAINVIRWVMDADNDGFYVGVPLERCTSPGPGYVIETNQQFGDCNDND